MHASISHGYHSKQNEFSIRCFYKNMVIHL